MGYLKLKSCKPHRPRCNGQCECFNVTVISVIDTLSTEARIIWQEQLSTLVDVYNCGHLNVTGFSPFYLMFGRHSMLPVDVQFGVRIPDIVPSTSHVYIQKLQRRLEWAYEAANVINQKESECSKKQYNWYVKCTKLEPGDLVLVGQRAFKGKHKINDRWENTPVSCDSMHMGGHFTSL